MEMPEEGEGKLHGSGITGVIVLNFLRERRGRGVALWTIVVFSYG